MQAYGIKRKQRGSVLMVVLIFLFVLTAIIASNSQCLIVNQKMQHAIQNEFLVLLRAEAGIQQTISQLEGRSFSLPASPITLNTRSQTIAIDQCGNKTVEITAVAEDDFGKVVLNSRDIFARVPREKNCPDIPLHRCVWRRMLTD